MSCPLLQYLEREKRLSDIRGERVNSARLKMDIENHRDRCVICAGVDENHLLNNFFGDLNITVLKDKRK